jgi:hypothetical protein
MNWGDNILKIADLYIAELDKTNDAEGYLKILCNSDIRVSILCLAYETLVNRKKIEPIESITKEEKLRLWEEAKRLCESDSEKYVVRASKALYCLGMYLQI